MKLITISPNNSLVAPGIDLFSHADSLLSLSLSVGPFMLLERQQNWVQSPKEKSTFLLMTHYSLQETLMKMISRLVEPTPFLSHFSGASKVSTKKT